MERKKRFVLVFNKWSIYHSHTDITEFDILKEAKEEMNLIEEIYADTPRPKKKYDNDWWYYSRNKKNPINTNYYIWDSEYLGEAFWGYLLLDRETEKILKWGHDFLKTYAPSTDEREVKDVFLRGEDEVPKDYKWACGEYKGWLQYRWGDGLNSIEYGDDAIVETSENKKECVRHCNRYKKKKYGTRSYDANAEAELDRLSAEVIEFNEAMKNEG